MHWSPVWAELAKRFRVVAPKMPGIGDAAAPGLRSFSEYARWLVRLLDALGVQRAWVVGNSFGAAVSWQLASAASDRCRGLVIVNGVPPVRPSPFARALMRLPGFLALFTAWYRRQAWVPSVLPRFFADPRLAPPELIRVLTDNPPGAPQRMRDVILAGDPPGPVPKIPVLVLWGEADRSMMINPGVARRLQRSIPGATLTLLARAGHLPQVERPEEFVRALESFAGGPR
jgi:pimeloyl-ACP methyl ester carboxylesterase